MYKRAAALCRRLSRWGGMVSGALIVALTLLILTEIFSRSLFNHSTLIADEYSGYLYLALVFFGLAYTFEENGHIRITLLTSRLKPRLQRLVDIFAAALSLAILLFALVYSWKFMWESKTMEMVSEGFSETPLYLTQIPMVIGLGLFACAMAFYLIRRIRDDQ